MAIATTLDKTRKDLEKTLADRTPLYAVVGAGDLAVARLREAGAELNSRAAKLDPRTAPDQLKSLPAKAQHAIGDVVSTALTTYGDLAGRGKSLVTRVRKQEETTDLQDSAKTAVSRARAATTTAKKSAAATKTAAKRTTTTARKAAQDTASGGVRSSAKGTATTAKKSAAKTRTATRSAATSARKTAAAARKAAEATVSKVGDDA